MYHSSLSGSFKLSNYVIITLTQVWLAGTLNWIIIHGSHSRCEVPLCIHPLKNKWILINVKPSDIFDGIRNPDFPQNTILQYIRRYLKLRFVNIEEQVSIFVEFHVVPHPNLNKSYTSDFTAALCVVFTGCDSNHMSVCPSNPWQDGPLNNILRLIITTYWQGHRIFLQPAT
jgi:hypothetical protein